MKSRRKINYNYYKNDNRPVIIFSNSLGCDLSMWEKQFDELKFDFSILRYDVRGHGESVPFDSCVFSMEDLALDVIDLLDELNISKVHFCGLSIGGLIGMHLAIYHASRFISFTLCNTAPKVGTAEGWNSRIELVKNEGLGPIADTSGSRWFTDEFGKKYPELVLKTTQAMRIMDKECYLGCCRVLANTDYWNSIKNITLPTLLISGLGDLVTTTKEAQEMQRLITDSRLVLLNAAHLSNIEDQKFSSELSKFLKDIS